MSEPRLFHPSQPSPARAFQQTLPVPQQGAPRVPLLILWPSPLTQAQLPHHSSGWAILSPPHSDEWRSPKPLLLVLTLCPFIRSFHTS